MSTGTADYVPAPYPEGASALVAMLVRHPVLPCPRPRNEREASEHELREELPAQLAAYRQDLPAGPADKTRSERLAWRIRRVEKRMADVTARLREKPL